MIDLKPQAILDATGPALLTLTTEASKTLFALAPLTPNVECASNLLEQVLRIRQGLNARWGSPESLIEKHDSITDTLSIKAVAFNLRSMQEQAELLLERARRGAEHGGSGVTPPPSGQDRAS